MLLAGRFTEAPRAVDAFGEQGLAAVVPFVGHGLAQRLASLVVDRTPISAYADLRMRGDFLRQRFGFDPTFAIRDDIFGKPDLQAFRGRDLTTGQNDFACTPLADQSLGSRTVPPSISGMPQRRQYTPK